jgi:hypothetical protein
MKPEDGFRMTANPITLADCYRFNLTNPAVDLCLMGPGSMADLTPTLETFEKGPMTAEEMVWMRRVGQAKYEKSCLLLLKG